MTTHQCIFFWFHLWMSLKFLFMGIYGCLKIYIFFLLHQFNAIVLDYPICQVHLLLLRDFWTGWHGVFFFQHNLYYQLQLKRFILCRHVGVIEFIIWIIYTWDFKGPSFQFMWSIYVSNFSFTLIKFTIDMCFLFWIFFFILLSPSLTRTFYKVPSFLYTVLIFRGEQYCI